MHDLVLASTSVHRANLLGQLGLNFIQAAPEYNENASIALHPLAMALRFSEGKATSLQNRYPNHIIIGSDQVAALENTIFGKPLNRIKAIEQLLQCNNRTVDFYTAITLINTKTKIAQQGYDKTSVTFRKLSRRDIERYVDKEKPYDCCGSFKIEGLGISLMSKVKSNDPSALIGLPLITLGNMLRQENIEVP